jgi:hypothetical protein
VQSLLLQRMKGCVGRLFRSVPRVEFNQQRGCDNLADRINEMQTNNSKIND